MGQPRKTWNAGDIPTAVDFNNSVRDLSIFAAGYPVYGNPPYGDGGGFLVQAGSAVVSTNSAGGAGFNFPVPFPGGVLSCMVMAGDGDSTHIYYATGILGQCTPTGWGGIIGGWINGVGSGPIATMGVRLSYIAIGF